MADEPPSITGRVCPPCAAGWCGDCENLSPVADLYPGCDHDCETADE